MGIVKISDEIHEELRKASQSFDRSLNGQAEHWLKIGLLAEIHPHLCYHDLLKMLLLNKSLKIEGLIKKAKKK
ncbi:MAG: hypothetical protein CME63_04355 [Halobacteriovoraceae bacterium]|nr:hypothetical protein [Halobacteriovoraceae bacterium]MBC96955.1 hypothetical protein [Halobacteriovoraceae bacterium]|tara:strand:- start:251906 stop:252124 length:219 start_codon:yes stop_codon:yes gene_type:complete